MMTNINWQGQCGAVKGMAFRLYMKIRPSIWVVLIATLALVALAMLFVDVIPPHSMTNNAMLLCKRRILRYTVEHNTLPSSLSQTAEIPNFDNRVKDGWGHDIIFSIATNGEVTLTSLGKDNRIGGANGDADMTGVFPSRKVDGSWADEFVAWKQDPFEQFRNQRLKVK